MPETWLINGVTIFNVHDRATCAGPHCPIHRPSDHHMRSWPLRWLNSAKSCERICPHGIAHPDPDQSYYLLEFGTGPIAEHRCDGCCRPPE